MPDSVFNGCGWKPTCRPLARSNLSLDVHPHGGAAVLIVKRSTGATLCHCATLGEVLAFLIGYDACRKDVPEGLDDDGP